jgi:hypothetical protein
MEDTPTKSLCWVKLEESGKEAGVREIWIFYLLRYNVCMNGLPSRDDGCFLFYQVEHRWRYTIVSHLILRRWIFPSVHVRVSLMVDFV